MRKRKEPKPEPDYHDVRPRRCAYCNAWFREPSAILPPHWAKGRPCSGSNKPEHPPLTVPRNSYWREDAACLGAESGFFWTTQDGPAMFEALSYCQRCPVLAQCYQHAEKDVHFTGVAGGTVWTPRERRLRREARALEEEGSTTAEDASTADADEADPQEHGTSAAGEE